MKIINMKLNLNGIKEKHIERNESSPSEKVQFGFHYHGNSESDSTTAVACLKEDVARVNKDLTVNNPIGFGYCSHIVNEDIEEEDVFGFFNLDLNKVDHSQIKIDGSGNKLLLLGITIRDYPDNYGNTLLGRQRPLEPNPAYKETCLLYGRLMKRKLINKENTQF